MGIKKTSRNKTSGIGLLELLLVLAVIAILLLMVTRYYRSAKESQRIGEAVSMMSSIIRGAADYSIANNHTYKGISLKALADGGDIPAGFCGNNRVTCPGLNPWNNTITVAETNPVGGYTVKMFGVPEVICTNAAAIIHTSLSNAAVGNSYAFCENKTAIVAVVY